MEQGELLATAARTRPKSARKSAAEEFAYQCRSHRLPRFETELLFADSLGRRWRFDFAFLPFRLAVEIEGLTVRRIGGQIVLGGRHATVTGFRDDCEKYANAVVLGWSVLRFEQSQVRADFAILMTMRALAARGWKAPA